MIVCFIGLVLVATWVSPSAASLIDDCSRTDDTPCLRVPNCAVGFGVADHFKVTNVPGDISAVQPTTVQVCWDQFGIHVSGNATDRHIFSPYVHCNDPVFINSDVMEVFIAPVYSATDNPIWYHEVDTGAAGALWGGLIHNPRGNASVCLNCTCSSSPCTLPCTGRDSFSPIPLSVTVQNGTGWWADFLFLPWNLFPAEFVAAGKPFPWPVWRANFYRYDYPDGSSKPYELSGWSPTHDPSFHVPARFGTLLLV